MGAAGEIALPYVGGSECHTDVGYRCGRLQKIESSPVCDTYYIKTAY